MDLISLLKEVCVIFIMISGIILGFWVFTADKRGKVNRIFLLLTLFSLAWILFSYLGSTANNLQSAIIMKRLNFAALMPFFVTAFLFSTYFPTELKRNRLIEAVFIIIGCLSFVISISTDFIVKGIHAEQWGNNVIGGEGYLVFNVLFFGLTIAIFANLIKKYLLLKKEARAQVQFMIIGASLYAFMNIIFNLILPMTDGSYKYESFGDFSVIFFLGFTAYAIVKHHLFNIRLIATELTVISLSIALFVEIFLSASVAEGSIKGMIWVLATYGGWQLIRSVKTEMKQKDDLIILTKQLEKANDHLKEVDKLKDDFLSMASHELNTPIAAIEGYLSMILDEKLCGNLSPKLEQYLTTVFQSSQRLAHLVKDLLNVSRIESNRIHIIWEQGQVEDLIDQSINEVMSKAKEAHHKLIFEKPKKAMPFTWYDKTRITEIILNFLGNSIKYTPNGGKIIVRAINDDQKIVVSVEDNGKGIPKDKGNRVFQKFTQVDVLKDEVKGTGLGMYISKRFVEMHGGKIWFKSDGEGKGTTFFFSLPIRKNKPFDPHDGEDAVLH